MFSPIISYPVFTPQKLNQYWKIMDNVPFLPQQQLKLEGKNWTAFNMD